MQDWIVILLSGSVVGLIHGLTGGGGAIISVPILNHLLGYTQAQAMGGSLLIVFVAAASGAWRGWQKREASLPHALVYGIVGGAFALTGALVAHRIPELVRGLGFAPVLLAAAFFVIRPAPYNSAGNTESASPALSRLALRESPFAAAVGALSGVFGISGGFLLVPILHLHSRLSFSQAVATSLLSVVASGIFGFFGALPFLLRSGLRWEPILGMAAVAFFFAQWVAGIRAQIPERPLKVGFGLLLVALAGLELWRLHALG